MAVLSIPTPTSVGASAITTAMHPRYKSLTDSAFILVTVSWPGISVANTVDFIFKSRERSLAVKIALIIHSVSIVRASVLLLMTSPESKLAGPRIETKVRSATSTLYGESTILPSGGYRGSPDRV